LINGLVAYLRKNGSNAGNRISEEQADYLLDTPPDKDLPDDYQTNDY
jgi:hypothetical protein